MWPSFSATVSCRENHVGTKWKQAQGGHVKISHDSVIVKSAYHYHRAAAAFDNKKMALAGVLWRFVALWHPVA